MTVVRWVFFDPATSTSYTVPINPSDGGSPSYEKTFQYQNTAAPNGKVLVFEGRQAVKKLNFEGKILDQSHFDALVTWWSKANQVTVTDDLGRTFSIIIEKFIPKRERAAHSPWKHSYSVEASIVDWT